MNKKKLVSLLIINCLVISPVCFVSGYKSAETLYSSVITNKTIISRIHVLESDLKKEQKIKSVFESQIYYRDKDLSDAELDERARLTAFVEKKDLEGALADTERKIEKLTKKIEKEYERLRKRNPDFKGAGDDE